MWRRGHQGPAEGEAWPSVLHLEGASPGAGSPEESGKLGLSCADTFQGQEAWLHLERGASLQADLSQQERM